MSDLKRQLKASVAFERACAGCGELLPVFGKFRTFFNTGDGPSDIVHDDPECVRKRNERRSQKPSTWQPIETAPHETTVLLWTPSDNGGVFEVGWASGGKRVALPGTMGTTSSRWWHGSATHWMPLPPPPASEG